MCGIVGIAGAREPELLRSMAAAIFHRGPDEDGFFEDRDVGLGSRRLAILDLEGGRQPISGEDGRVSVVFSGEIYNHLELRKRLEAAGHRFKTRTDTEVLVHLYEDLGSGLLSELRGMYAFAIFDRRERALFIARDRLGIKPLYYAVRDGVLYFASELKALLLCPIPKELDPASVREYVDLLYVASPNSMLASVKKLEPGGWLKRREGRLELGRHWEPEVRPEPIAEDEALARLDELVAASVREQRVADVPVGLFLSGGLDSSLLAAYLAREPNPPTAYCLKTGHPGFDELDKAKAVAGALGLALEEVPVEARPDLDGFLSAVDEPLADSSMIATWWVSKASRSRVKAAMTGVGGDELFGGYPRYAGARWLEGYARAPKAARRLLARWAGELPDQGGSRNVLGWVRRFLEGGRLDTAAAYRAWMGHAPRDLYGPALFGGRADPVLTALHASSGLDPVSRALATDLRTYLPDDLLALADRASMAASLELRVPLLDERIVEFACRLPPELRVGTASLKVLQRKLLARFLPEPIVNQKKRGFMVPMADWLRGELREPLEEALSESSVRRRGLFDPAAVSRVLREHQAGTRSRPDLLWALLLLELWQRKRLPSAVVKAGRARLSILVVSDFHFQDSEGGAGRVALETARGLAALGHRVACWGPAPAGAPATECSGGLEIDRFGEGLAPAPRDWPGYARRARASIAEVARRTRPQVLLAHQPRAAWLAEGADPLEDVPVVYFFHSCWAEEYRLDGDGGPRRRLLALAREKVERSALARARRFAVLSAYMRQKLLAHGAPEHRVRRVPPGVDLEEFQSGRARNSGPFTVLTVRNLRARMGLDSLLDAMASFLRHEPGARLVIAGEGPLLGELQAKAGALGLADSVRFPGRVTEAALAELYRESDLFVLPSREHEGLGLVLLEALASGVPAVGTPVGGIPEVLEALDPAWIADGTGPEAIAAAMRRAAPAARDPSRKAACRRFAEGFPWSRTAEALEQLLLEAAS